jgi:23S rRNA (uracil1939-C5)-methyltransferase
MFGNPASPALLARTNKNIITIQMSEKRFESNNKNIPETLQLTIEELNEKGDGIAYLNKLKITVQKVLPGEVVRIKYLPKHPRKDRIKLLKILNYAPNRVTPPCLYFESCGGCQLQQLSYLDQLKIKKQIIEKLLKNYPNLKLVKVSPVIGLQEPTFYRNKTQMPFQSKNDQIFYGLFQKGTHKITPINNCLIENRDANQALQIVRNWAVDCKIPVYNEKNHQGYLRHTVIRRGQFTNQVMVVIVSNKSDITNLNKLVKRLKVGLPTIKSIILNINNNQGNIILGKKNINVWGDNYIEERLGRIRFKLYPTTFFQANTIQMIRLLEKMKEVVNFNKNDLVIDLFCGVGAIGLYIANQVKKVIGIENNLDAVNTAKENLILNNIRNIEFFSANLTEGFAHLVPRGYLPHKIILDPPRKGLSPELILEIIKFNPEKIIYISCNPKSLSRDLSKFSDFHYFTEIVYPVDMFPQTSHIESLVVLERK